MGDDQSVTFLFTDIEGSTPMWERATAEMSGSVARHDEILRRAIDDAGGRVVKDLGDGLYATFQQPQAAVLSAVVAMRHLLAEPWPAATPVKVRMGIHMGEAQSRGGDFYGPAVNRAARLMAAAHGGQIVVSAAVAGAVEATHSAGVFALRELGSVPLRGFSVPEAAYQVVADGLPEAFPPLAGTVVPTNLPATTSTFVGREVAVAAVTDRLAKHRFVTLVGFGGAGKTRLAVETAGAAMATFPDGVWFVDLAAVSDDTDVAQAAASTLGVGDDPSRPGGDALATHLYDASVLLILDNCEHVLGGAARLVEGLLRSTQRLRVLATSRARIDVDGEVVLDVAPLATGVDGPAMQLFVDRARAVRSGFTPDGAQRSAVVDIVRELDGIPLAIELAAAAVRLMDPTEILARLDDRFRLLVGGRRTARPRQQTLRGLVGWSYSLLQDDERRFFDRLSVFAGSFTLTAADAICSEEGSGRDSLDLLAGLVDQSMVHRVPADDDTRFGLLETVRQFGAERLDESGIAPEIAARHAGFFAMVGANADADLKGPHQAEWQRRLSADEANFLRSLRWLSDHDPERALELASQLDRLWYRRGMVTVGIETTQRALDVAAATPTPARARALAWLAFFLDVGGDTARARQTAVEARVVADAAGDREVRAQVLNVLGGFANDDGELHEAVELWRRALHELDAAESPAITAPLFNLGYGLVELGRLDEAVTIAERLTELGHERQDRFVTTMGRLLGGYAAFGSGALDEADRAADDARIGFDEQGAVFHVAEACLLRASIAEVRGDLATAHRELDAARAVVDDTEIFDQADAQVLQARIALRGGDVAAAAAHLAGAATANRADPNPLTTARVLYEAARLAARGDQAPAAVELIGAAERVVTEARVRPPAHLVDEAAAVLGEAARSVDVDDHLVRGRALDPDAAAALAAVILGI